MNSERLQAEGNVDLASVKHDKVLQRKSQIQPHLQHIPSYLVPFEIPQDADPAANNKKPVKKRKSRDPLKANFHNDKKKQKVDILKQMEAEIRREDPEYEMERRFMKPVEKKKRKRVSTHKINLTSIDIPEVAVFWRINKSAWIEFM